MLSPSAETSFFAADRAAVPLYTGLRLLSESQSGFCRIFECVRQGRHVVVKALRPDYAASEVHRSLLRKEYEIASSLYHPGIVRTIGFEQVPGVGEGFVMEYAGGSTLDAYVASGRCDPARARDILAQLCSALAYMHSRGVVHRDIKPANIMVDDSSGALRVCLIDFGLSSGLRYDALEFPAGTRSFSAPEQFVPDAEVTSRADIYSLGRVMLTMLPARCRSWRSVARRCAEPDPARRPASVEAVPAMLRRERTIRRVAVAGTMLAAVIAIALMQLRPATAPPVTADYAPPAATVPVAPQSVPASVAPSIAPHVTLPAEAQTADTVTRTPLSATVPAPTPASYESLESQVFARSRQAAEQWFAWEIHALDTLTTSETYSLLIVDHWQWQARQQVRRWLVTQIDPRSPYVDDMMDLAARTIADYADDPANQAARSRAQGRAVRRYARANEGTVLGATTSYSYPQGDRRVTRTLQPDGSWSTSVTSTRPPGVTFAGDNH